MRLDHIGIAVTSIDEAAKFYEQGLGLKRAAVEEVAEQQVRVLKFDTGNTKIELIEPSVAGQGPIGTYLSKRGPGIHHICLQVADIHAAATHLAEQGYRPLTDQPQPGANGCLVLFLHPKDTHGTLIELSQPPA